VGFEVCVKPRTVFLGKDKQAEQSREGRLDTGMRFQPSLAGLYSFVGGTQDYVLGYSQPVPTGLIGGESFSRRHSGPAHFSIEIS
jgi:hypothetical protein